MTQQSVRNLSLFGLTWPIFIELLLQMVMGNADTLMLSYYSDNAVASVGVANRIIYILILIYGVIATGASVLVAKALGAKEDRRASEIAVVSIGANLVIGLALSGTMYVTGDQLLRVMGLPEELLREAMQYIVIVGGFSFFPAVALTISAVLRCHGFAKDVMLVTIGMNIVDVIGNYLFIFGPFGIPVLGVFGVAMTTTISKAMGLVFLVAFLLRRVENPLPFHTLIRFPFDHLRQLLKIGVPSACELLSYHTSQLAITYIAAFLGTQALTTKVYTENLMMFIYLFSMAISQGTQILIGHQSGANQFQQVYERCIVSTRISFAISLGMGVILYLFSPRLLTIFTDDASIIHTGSLLLLMTILLEPGRSINLVILGALRALGDIQYALYLGIISMWGISVALSYLLAITLDLGLLGIWISYVIDEWLRGLVLLKRWRARRWLSQTNIEIQG
ncbi:putative MATE family efflux protein [Paenibacillus phyllosphaerae]|uniref:Putative MATE family efflux protein n=1 Tax=Paenibacillus phyllosphaerae TaxID=274593 RepID=A0A7W5AWZ1_9BACL|nr:MATE family efflux transporter [Paenibacillus phyllosphaerae]MBB3110117.1 putative MATE family efflux protein [Paenibacillus phyllosphaerae]